MDYKTLRNALVGISAVMVYGCGTEGGSGEEGNGYTPQVGENYILSGKGKIEVVFPGGVIKETNDGNLNAQSTQIEVYLPHNGGIMEVYIHKDNDGAHIYATSDKGNIHDDEVFSLNTNASWDYITALDVQNSQGFYNEPFIYIQNTNLPAEISITGEGIKREIKNFVLYSIENSIAKKEDNLPPYTIYINALPDMEILSDNECPARKEGKNIVVPPHTNCIKIEFQNKDNIGENPQYSLDQNIWNELRFGEPTRIDITNPNLEIYIKETLRGKGKREIEDIKKHTLNITYETPGNLDVWCYDAVSHTYLPYEGMCIFLDPRNITELVHSEIQITHYTTPNDTSTCEMTISKNGTEIDKTTGECDGLTYSYPITLSDAGMGTQTLNVVVHRIYDNNTKQKISEETIQYMVDKAPIAQGWE